MSESESDRLVDSWRDAAQKFDYFMAGVAIAITAYIGKSYTPARIGLNPETLEFASLVLFLAASLCAFRRIEVFVNIHRSNISLLQAKETARGLFEAFEMGHEVRVRGQGTKPAEEVLAAAENWGSVADDHKDAIDHKVRDAVRWYRARNYLLLAGLLLYGLGRLAGAYT